MKKLLRLPELTIAFALALSASSGSAQTLTYAPYIQPGDNSEFGASDQMVIAWQTDEKTPANAGYLVEYGTSLSYGSSMKPTGRVVNNYLSADASVPVPTAATGPKSDYVALLKGLAYDTVYYYRVTGPAMPAGGFTSKFRTRTQSGQFSFLVEGDEGFFPSVPDSTGRMANYEARIVHLMYNASTIPLPNEGARTAVSFAVNTGDNVYNVGSEGSYRDYWMPVWNNNVDSNETGAPLIRSMPFYIVAGNHDTGGNGDTVNLLGSVGAGKYSGNLEGGDALAYFNNYYYPLNGPTGFDSQYVFNGDQYALSGWFLNYKGTNYTSQPVFDAYRSSTIVDTGKGAKAQSDRMANFSYDYGNAHFLFLDANPHLFSNVFDYNPIYAGAPVAFPNYPSRLRRWVINDLDSSSQPWKFIVFHQGAFSSGNGTLHNTQMRSIVKLLEDHGANMVFNGHEHNYQRTLPLRGLARVAEPADPFSEPAVEVDTQFDGRVATVPDGVIYIVDGAGGNRDFDGAKPTPRGQGDQLNQDDSATGVFTYGPGLTFPQGPASWLDTSLTNSTMTTFFPGAGSGQKITAVFKSTVFSFSQVVVKDNMLTLYQISEPLSNTSSATADTPAPFGTDYFGAPLHDPIGDTLLDSKTGALVSTPSDGPSALLDKFTVLKPNMQGQVLTTVAAPATAVQGDAINYAFTVVNNSQFPLNGVQLSLTLPVGVLFDGAISDVVTLHGKSGVMVTLGRLAPGEFRTVTVPTRLSWSTRPGAIVSMSAQTRSSTAMLNSNAVATTTVTSFTMK